MSCYDDLYDPGDVSSYEMVLDIFIYTFTYLFIYLHIYVYFAPLVVNFLVLETNTRCSNTLRTIPAVVGFSSV